MLIGDGRNAIALSKKKNAVFWLDGSTLGVIFKSGKIKDPYQYLLPRP